MFRTIAMLVFLLTVALIGAHASFARPWALDVASDRTVRRWGGFSRLVHLVTLVSFFVLAVSGFWPVLAGQDRLAGYWLGVHTMTGTVFATGLAAMALLWAHAAAFEAHDGRWLRRGGLMRRGDDLPAGRLDAGQKLFFWALLTLGLVSLGTILLSMIPLFGAEGLGWLYEVHRYAGLALAVLVVLHTYRQTLGRPGVVRSMINGRVSERWARLYHPLWRAKATETEHNDA